MRTFSTLLFIIFLLANINSQTIKSPSGKLELTFQVKENGTPVYSLTFAGSHVIKESRLGVTIENKKQLHSGFSIVKVNTSEKDEYWNPVWGEVKTIRNNYRQLYVMLENAEAKVFMNICFRLYDDGLGFRYEFPVQNELKYFTLLDEATEFSLTGDAKVFWIPGDYDSNEYTYNVTKLSEIESSVGKNTTEIGAKSNTDGNVVQTPLMLVLPESLYVNIHEAALVDYPAMQLNVEKSTYRFTAHLVPDITGKKAYLQTPCSSPWRTIIVSDKAVDILSSKTILNLNEPSVIKDVSWIKPQKFVGIWWELHVGKSTWNYSDINNVKLNLIDWSKVKPNGKHGATTERTKFYIDFAAKHGFDGVLVEGWNVGWEDWYGNRKEEVFDFITPYPDFDVVEVQKYAAKKGVKIIMHHETSASVTNYERRMDEAFTFMKKHGYNTVKTGYVGRIIPRSEYHDGQWMVNHYVRVAEKAAKYKIMIDAHEPVRPTGLHRTYPNWLACEAARGNEFNAWSIGNVPAHETILPFTRLMGGPMDYTPGIFQITMNYYNPGKTERVHTTLAKQLALYVTMYSPVQMVSDLPENYMRFPDAFQFIKDVAVDWDDSRYIEAEPGEYITVARKEKNGPRWFIGAITNEKKRSANISLNFLDEGKMYVADVYRDADNAHWFENPMSYKVEHFLVSQETVLRLQLAEGGGVAVTLRPAKNNELKTLKLYQ